MTKLLAVAIGGIIVYIITIALIGLATQTSINNWITSLESRGYIVLSAGEYTSIDEKLDIIEQETYETEKHIHGNEKWFGVAAVASGETHVADRVGPAIAPFALLSGNDAYGNWLQVLGSSDTPVEAGMTQIDAHRILVTTTDSTEPFVVQFVVGESAGIAAKISAEEMTEFPYIAATNNADAGITPIISKRISTGTKVWARAICIGQTAKTINIYVGTHEYVR